MFRINKDNLDVFYTLLIFVICYLILLVIAIRPISTFDGFWHLQMGEDFVENGMSPWIDHYSFSFYGKEISTIPVLFQVLLFKFISAFGESEGFYYLKVFYITTLMPLLFVYFRKINASWFVVFLLLPIIVYFIQLRMIIRPEIFSNVLILICLLLFLNAKQNFSTKHILFICLLLLFWVNYHSPIIGYIIIFGLFVDKAIAKYFKGDDSFSWKFWFGWGLVIFCIGFMRPNGQHFLLTVYSLLTEDFSSYTAEYAASYPMVSYNIIVHASWILSLYVVIWSIIKKQYGFAITVCLLTYFSWSTVRMLSVAMLVNLSILALYFSEFFNFRGKLQASSAVKNSLFFVAAGISIWTFYVLGLAMQESLERHDNKKADLESRYPVKLVDYMNNYQEEGNVLNLMRFGGYLINKLSPGFKIYFDGRTNILYPAEFMKHNIYLLERAEELNETIEKYNIKYALFKNTPEIFSKLKKNDTLTLNYADENYILFSKEKENAFPIASTLLIFPSCWKDDWAQTIQYEINYSSEMFKGNERKYELQLMLAFIEKYLAAEDGKAFFDDYNMSLIGTDSVRRVASYFALREGNKNAWLELFMSIRDKNEYDILLQAYHLASNNEFEEAETLLFYFYTVTKYVKKKHLAFDKIAIMIHVLGILESNIELQHFEPSYKSELEGKLKKSDYSNNNVLSFEHICK